MLKDIPEEQLVKRGRMVKSPFGMTVKEEKEWMAQNAIRARARIFAVGQPLVYKMDGQMVAEHADGRIEIIH